MSSSIAIPAYACSPAATGARNAGLIRALAVSVALHALILAQAPESSGGGAGASAGVGEGRAMSARLRPGAGPRIAPQAQLPQSPQSSTRSDPAVVRPSHPQEIVAPDTHHDAFLRDKAAVAPVQASANAADVAPSAGPSAGDDAVDAAGLRQYRVALAVAARQFKDYPARVLSQGARGSVGIRLAIGADGFAQPAQLQQGSGTDALDAAALRMIDAAARDAPMPGALHGRRFNVDIQLDFSP